MANEAGAATGPGAAGGVRTAAGSAEEAREFAALQRRLRPLAERVLPDANAAQTVVVVPSMSLDTAELRKLAGAAHYEERLLCLLMLLRAPRTRLVYVTSQPIAPAIVDYYLQLLPGVPVSHARRRLTLLSCHDGSPRPLTEKILARPRLLDRIRGAVADPEAAHLTCFNATPLERTLAVRLGLPLYACDPALAHLGTKSGSRTVFERAGVPAPDGFEQLRDADDVAGALAELKERDPALERAVVKLNDGFSGEGNATFSFAGAPAGSEHGGGLRAWARRELPGRLRFEAPGEAWEPFAAKLAAMGGVVEAFVAGAPGAAVRSPSVQCHVDPTGAVQVLSTHDQVLGGPSGQVFLGCTFPADDAYRRALHDAGRRVAEVLRGEGVIGRFAVDFVSVDRGGGAWEHRAIEINLRMGGTTHPYLMLQFLTDGAYDPETGVYCSRTGRPCHYVASDNLSDAALCGLTPDDLIDIAVDQGLHFDTAAQQGVMFHLIGALSEHGKLGTVCVADTPDAAQRLYRRTAAVLEREAQRGAGGTPASVP
jgi:hypothetical protein